MKLPFTSWRPTTGHVGIAFDDDVVRMVQVRDNGRLSITGAGMVEVGGLETTHRSATSLAESIHAAFVAGGFTGRRCVVSLAPGDVWMQSVRMPVMPADELSEAVTWEAAERFGMDRQRIQCDWLRMSGDQADRQEVLLVAASRDVLEARLTAVLDAGLRPVAVETNFTAVGRLFSRRHRRDADREDGRAVIEVGHTGSMLLMLQGSELVFCKPLPVGGCHLDQQIAERLDLEVQAVADLRRSRICGSEPLDPATEQAVTEAARPVLAELARDAMRCLRHYSVTVRGSRTNRLVVTGAHAGEPGLAQALERVCRMEVSTDDDSGCMRDLTEGLAQRTTLAAGFAGAWTTAAGLSLRSTTPAARRRAA